MKSRKHSLNLLGAIFSNSIEPFCKFLTSKKMLGFYRFISKLGKIRFYAVQNRSYAWKERSSKEAIWIILSNIKLMNMKMIEMDWEPAEEILWQMENVNQKVRFEKTSVVKMSKDLQKRSVPGSCEYYQSDEIRLKWSKTDNAKWPSIKNKRVCPWKWKRFRIESMRKPWFANYM